LALLFALQSDFKKAFYLLFALLSERDVFAMLSGFGKNLCSYAVLPFAYDLHDSNGSSITGIIVVPLSTDCNYERSGIQIVLQLCTLL